METSPIPPGFHSVTPHLVVRNAPAAIDFYRTTFGAREIFRMPGSDGTSILHAELEIGDSKVMLGEQSEEMGSSPEILNGTPVTLHLYVPNADEVFERATDAGAEVLMPLSDTFWGDRYGKIRDPFGHEWSIATHVRNVSPEELQHASKTAPQGQTEL